MPKSLLPRRAATSLAAGAILLAGCSPTEPEPAAAPSPGPESETEATSPSLPPDATAEATTDDTCPYLDTEWLADTNGQRVTHQGTDPKFDPPACVFWSYEEAPQATVIVRHMPDRDTAIQAVDWAAPIDRTEPVEEDGWSGGRGVLDDASVYAVQKDNVAVLVWSDQLQSVKPEGIAKQVIANLEL